MSLSILLTRRSTIAGIGTAALLSMVGLQPAPGSNPEAAVVRSRDRFPDSLVLPMSYGGVGAEGVDLIWRGTSSAGIGGQVTVRMAYAGTLEDRGMPVWPVTALLFFSADEYRSSFIAELSGTMDWEERRMIAAGVITDGAGADTRLEQVLQLDRKWSGSLTLRFQSNPPASVAAATAKD
jgi:hypothetical protein